MSLAPIIQEVEDCVNNSSILNIMNVGDALPLDFVDDLAIVAHVRSSTDLHSGVSVVYDALHNAAAKRGLYLNMKKRKIE
eukprot:5595962-Karenia_brevis.AAC.1